MDHGIDMLAAWRAAQHVNPRAHRDVGPTAVVAAWVSVTPWVLWGDGGFPIFGGGFLYDTYPMFHTGTTFSTVSWCGYTLRLTAVSHRSERAVTVP
jgi:hypothetical protein